MRPSMRLYEKLPPRSTRKSHCVAPFPFLSVLSRGSGGRVSIINQHIVFKCPTVFDNAAPQQADEMKESAERIAREKAMYEILTANRHPNILRCILLVQQGLFHERMKITLQARIDNETLGSLSWRRESSSHHLVLVLNSKISSSG